MSIAFALPGGSPSGDKSQSIGIPGECAPRLARGEPAVTDTRLAHVRRIEQPIRSLFPPERQSSPAMVGLLVRSDELVYLLMQFQEARAEEARRESVGDPRPVMWRFILARLLVVSAHDALELLDEVMQDAEIRRLLAEHGERGAQFTNAIRKLRKDREELRPVRSQLGAHLDTDTIRRALAGPHGREHGKLWIGELLTDSQFDLAHEVALAAWSHRKDAPEPKTTAEAVAEVDRLVGLARDVQIEMPKVIRVLLRLFEGTHSDPRTAG